MDRRVMLSGLAQLLHVEPNSEHSTFHTAALHTADNGQKAKSWVGPGNEARV